MSHSDIPSRVPLWDEIATQANIALTDAHHARLAQYLDLLLAANTTMNLTRVTERQQAELHHVADALTLLRHLPAQAFRLADIGSGGGSPGLPLAIVRPDVHVMLIEATKKKSLFLRQTAEALGLKNVSVSHWRAEEVGRSNSRETFDVATARAVGVLVWLVEWGLPLLKMKGKLLAMKGPKVADELPAAARAIRLLGGSAPLVHPVELPGTEHHVIVEISKVLPTPAIYPRPASSAKGKPIG